MLRGLEEASERELEIAAAQLTRDAIVEELTRLRELIALAPVGIFLADLDGRYTDVNEAGCRMLGYAREEIVGKTIVDLIPEGDVPRLAESKEALLDGQVHVAEWQLRRKDGTYVPVEVSAKIFADGRWQGFVRDLTDRKRTEAELAAKNRALEDADQMKDEMISVVAHDLRTPLTSIHGYLELATEDGVTPEEQRKFLGIVQRSSKRLERLADDLLFISRLRAGRLELEPERVQVRDVLQSVVDAVAPSTAARGIELSLEGTGCEVVADAHRVFQAVENLVSNAIKFSPEGSVVTLGVEPEAEGARIFVRDHGQGISAADLEHVFERFFRAAGTETVPGAGLGLSIVKAVAEAHGGTVRVQSTPGEGATFVLWLPAEPRA